MIIIKLKKRKKGKELVLHNLGKLKIQFFGLLVIVSIFITLKYSQTACF